MRNIWRIFRSDWQRISASVVAVVVVMGLCLIPCLYAWFNIFSNWDPYGPDSTSNIRVAVTSEDEGYELLGLKLNIGSMVLDGLKSNHQMGWDFVDSREEALEGVRSGKYYAALIVPSDFTGDFVSILDTDLRHPQIQYYENQKKNAIAPKITNKAKTAVQDEINATVVETVTDAVTTVSSVCKALGLDADDVSQGIIDKLGSAQESLLALENTLSAMQTLVDQTDNILACAGVVSDDLNNIVKTGDLSGVQDALNRGVGRPQPNTRNGRKRVHIVPSTTVTIVIAPCQMVIVIASVLPSAGPLRGSWHGLPWLPGRRRPAATRPDAGVARRTVSAWRSLRES